MTSLGFPAQAIGSDCVELIFRGDARVDTAARLEDTFNTAMDERRHVLLNLQGCEYINSKALTAIAAGRERLARAGLDLIPFGASGVVRPLLEAQLRQGEEVRSSDLSPLPRLIPRAARS